MLDGLASGPQRTFLSEIISAHHHVWAFTRLWGTRSQVLVLAKRSLSRQLSPLTPQRPFLRLLPVTDGRQETGIVVSLRQGLRLSFKSLLVLSATIAGIVFFCYASFWQR